MAIWEVNLFVYGPITIKRPIELTEPKGNHYLDPFYSNINIQRTPSGIEATVTASASTNALAYKAAFLFFGQMLDALTLYINQPMYLSIDNNRRPVPNEVFTTRRRVEIQEWKRSFREARILGFSEQDFLRALGWYRKGLYTEDPFDKFLAFWNSIEIVASKYHPPIPTGRTSGSKSQIWESFKDVWGECENWPNIPGNTEWIDDNYDTRRQIAHGTTPIDIQKIEDVINKINVISKVAYQFLNDWRDSRLTPELPPDIALEDELFSDS